MPYKNCQKILEDGHRCNRTFKVPTHRSSRKLCPEHERKETNKGAGIRNVQGKQEKMREFLDDLYTWKIEAMDRRIDKVVEQQRALGNKLDMIVNNMEKMSEDFRTMKDLNAKIAESVYQGPEYYDKLQRQIIALNNKIVKMSDNANLMFVDENKNERDENDKRNKRTRTDME